MLKENCSGKSPTLLRIVGLILCLSLAVPVFLTGCGGSKTADTLIADYGDYGSQIAKTLAEKYSFRKAYSPEEKEAGIYVKNEFEKLGYKVEEQVFSSSDKSGTSTNYIVKIPGEGFMFENDQGAYTLENRQVIVGAHYDTVFGTSDSASKKDFDGIQDNASGIGCLLTLAKELKTQSMGYDVILVAFGAGDDKYAGASAFEAKMTADEISSTDAMYCVESIYAGDKLYASAGWNSLIPGRKYDMRRKLYEAYDVVYENSLSSKNGVDLLYNESSLSLDVNSDGITDVYREVTTTISDYVPFDRAGIPIVFFESYDYNYKSVPEMKETKNLKLQSDGGMIRRTNNDSLSILEDSLTKDQLKTRINNTAFILLMAIEKGANNSITKEQYAAGTTIAPTIQVLVTVTPPEQSTSASSASQSSK
jgi:alkaline phosphatase isozyme conversion protein